MNKTIIAGCVLAAYLGSGTAQADETVCRHFADNIRDRIVTILHNHAMSYTKKRAALSGLFDASVDSAWIARFVAGAAWRGASEPQRAEYVKAYKVYLSNQYIGGINEDDLNNMTDLKIVDFKPMEGTTYDAHAQIVQKNEEPVDIDLRLEEEPATVCHVRDFTVEGVSLLTSQRDQIQELAAQGGLANVTQKLREFAVAKSN